MLEAAGRTGEHHLDVDRMIGAGRKGDGELGGGHAGAGGGAADNTDGLVGVVDEADGEGDAGPRGGGSDVGQRRIHGDGFSPQLGQERQRVGQAQPGQNRQQHGNYQNDQHGAQQRARRLEGQSQVIGPRTWSEQEQCQEDGQVDAESDGGVNRNRAEAAAVRLTDPDQVKADAGQQGEESGGSQPGASYPSAAEQPYAQ